MRENCTRVRNIRGKGRSGRNVQARAVQHVPEIQERYQLYLFVISLLLIGHGLAAYPWHSPVTHCVEHLPDVVFVVALDRVRQG